MRLNQEKNVTVILTTHYTEEGDYLCNRILIIDFGKIVVLGTPENLKAQLEGDVVTLVFNDSEAIEKYRPLLENKKWIRKINVVSSDNNYAAMSLMMQSLPKMSINLGMNETMPHMGSGNIKLAKNSPKQAQQNLEEDMIDNNNLQIGRGKCSKCLNLLVDNGGHRIPEIVKLADEAKVVLDSVELHKPTLDDVFLSVTGRNIREEEGSLIDMMRRHRIIQQARGGHVRD